MTPKQQRIAIAEACGLFRLAPLKRTNRNGKDNPLGVRLWYCVNDHGGAKEYADLPDYLNDLNAMHEAQKILKLGMRNRYDAELSLIAERDHCFIWETTAAQRADAFCETLNLWEE